MLGAWHGDLLNEPLLEPVMPTSDAAAQPILVAIMSLLTSGHRSGNEAHTLTISGGPRPTAVPTVFYNFTPTVAHNSHRTLLFTIRNKPSWAAFGLRHGTLYGVPKSAHAGTYPNIVITVSDGEKTVELPPFSITVAPS